MENEMMQIKATIAELIININNRIDDIISRYESEGMLNDERVTNILEDMQSLTEGIGVIYEHVKGIDLLEFKEKLGMLVMAMESSDSALFIDVLKFEVKDLLDYWKDCLIK